jgi:hypothetical protein
MSTYTFSIGGYSSSSAWSSGSDVVKDIGVVSDVTGAQNLSVKAIDSRAFYKTVTKSVEVVPYASPAFVNSLKVRYTNNFDKDNGLTLEADGSTIANVSPITVSASDKNVVNGTTGVQFRIKKGEGGTYSSYENVTTSQGTGTGAITATLATVASDILTEMNTIGADNTEKWYVEFKIVDSLETTYKEVEIDIGRSILRIGDDGNLYHNEVEFHEEFGYGPKNRFYSTSSTATLAPNVDNYTHYRVKAQTQTLTISNPTGTKYDGMGILFELQDNGTLRNITWGTEYVADSIYGLSLPGNTGVVNKTTFCTFVYYETEAKWKWVA